MARIRCNYVDCIFLENRICGAATVELDPDEGCMTYTPIGQVGVDVDENWEEEELEELWDDEEPLYQSVDEEDDIWDEE